MIIFFLKAQQMGLFDAPVPIKAHSTKTGGYVRAHTRIMKVSAKTPSKPMELDFERTANLINNIQNNTPGTIEKHKSGKFLALEEGTKKPIRPDGSLGSAYGPPLYDTEDEAKAALQSRATRNANLSTNTPANKTSKAEQRAQKLAVDRDSASKIASSIAVPEGYSVAAFEQPRSGTNGNVIDVYVQVKGNYDDELHKRIKRAGGHWDGKDGGNTKSWLMPIEKAEAIEKVFKNTEKAKAKAAAANDAKAKAESEMKPLRGQTFEIKETLKREFGAKWDGESWKVSPDKYEAAQKFVDSRAPAKTSEPAATKTSGPAAKEKQSDEIRVLHPLDSSYQSKLPNLIERNGKKYKLSRVGSSMRISEDHPSFEGSHLFGYEGSLGAYHYYTPI